MGFIWTSVADYCLNVALQIIYVIIFYVKSRKNQEENMSRQFISKGRDSCSSVVYIHQVSSETCEPGHSFGPAVRDHYLIHCIMDGEGSYYVGKRKYHLTKGEGFLIVP